MPDSRGSALPPVPLADVLRSCQLVTRAVTAAIAGEKPAPDLATAVADAEMALAADDPVRAELALTQVAVAAALELTNVRCGG